MKKHVYREGDTVRIVEPEFFVRVGYPLTCGALVKEWEREENAAQARGEEFTFGEVEEAPAGLPDSGMNAKINEAMKLLGLSCGRFRVRRDFVDGVAKAMVREQYFGGKERRIYTKRREHAAGSLGTVTAKKRVMTGDYYPPMGWDDDWEPGGLTNAQTHVILLVAGYWIEAKNVEPYRGMGPQ